LRPTHGSEYCFFHDPDKALERLEAQSLGGSRGKDYTLPPDTPDIAGLGPENVKELLRETISQVRRGDLSPRVATAVGYLSSIALKANELGEIDERLKGLEQAVTDRQETGVF
jgi:hypothetical protein